MESPGHIAIVDDDRRIREMLANYLEEEGFEVSPAENGDQLRAAMAAGKVDLVLLDQVIPGEDGLTLLRELRRHSNVPVIMITGKGEMLDRIVGLEVGADDYIAKPFHLREVLARIRAVLRRCAPAAVPMTDTADAETQTGRLTFAGWILDLQRRELRNAGGDEIELTTGELVDFALLSPSSQEDVIRQVSSSADQRDALHAANTHMAAAFGLTPAAVAATLERNAQVVRDNFAPRTCGDRLLRMYSAVLASERGARASALPHGERILDFFLGLQRFRPLRSQ